MPKRGEELLSTTQVCDEFGGLDRSTVVRWVQMGHLQAAMKLPGATGAYLFRRADVERLLAKRSAAGNESVA